MFGSIFDYLFDTPNLTFTTFILVFTVCILVQRLCFSGSRTGLKLPPSPGIQLPLIGHLYLLSTNMAKSFQGFRKKVGDVYRLRFGNRDCIVISGFDAIKDAFVKNGDVFTYRPILPLLERVTRGAGLICANGDKWKEHRRFTLTTLKDFGMGRSFLEKRIHEEIRVLLEVLEAKNDQPFNPKRSIQTNVSNIIFSMIFGSTFKHGDSKFTELITAFEENMEGGVIAGSVNFLPFLEYLPGDFFFVKRALRNSANVFRFVHDIIADHQESLDEENITDYVSAYLVHLQKLEKSGDPTSFSILELAATTADLFIAGSETTTATLSWALPLLATHPEMQQKLFDEVTSNVGTERLPEIQDKPNLVYVEAFFMEVLRYANLTTISLPRATSRDTEFRGYHIPEATMVFMDMPSVLSDPDIWTDPENFRPSRFIDDSGHLKKMEEFIPFSLGKRNCVGESLARMELLLFLSAIVQRFELVCPEGADLSMAKLGGEFKTIPSPKPYEIIFRKRS